MKKLIIAALMLTALGCSQKITTYDLKQGISKDEVVAKFGAPESSGMQGNKTMLYYTLHDHAFGNDKNAYAFVFQNDKLTEYYPTSAVPRDSGGIGVGVAIPLQ